LSFYGKRPGPGMRLDKLSMQFAMHDTGLISEVLEAYERLILDAMRGDHTLFTTAEGIERLWEGSMPLLEAPPPGRVYPPRGLGPKIDPPAGRAQCLAAAVRAGRAHPHPRRRLTPAQHLHLLTRYRFMRAASGGDPRLESRTGTWGA